jgi:hypothetical protein
VNKLKERVKTRLQLQEIKYECGWNVEHFSGCLKSLDKLADLHESDMCLLKKRILVFAPFTGISLDGHVMLFTGDVQSNWLDVRLQFLVCIRAVIFVFCFSFSKIFPNTTAL